MLTLGRQVVVEPPSWSGLSGAYVPEDWPPRYQHKYRESVVNEFKRLYPGLSVFSETRMVSKRTKQLLDKKHESRK